MVAAKKLGRKTKEGFFKYDWCMSHNVYYVN
jgi:3-hydroxyacyl-CoA dehydrogenase